MSVDVFTMSCGPLQGAKLVGFKGTESLCRPFEMEVFFTVAVGTDASGKAIPQASSMSPICAVVRPACFAVSFRVLRQS